MEWLNSLANFAEWEALFAFAGFTLFIYKVVEYIYQRIRSKIDISKRNSVDPYIQFRFNLEEKDEGEVIVWIFSKNLNKSNVYQKWEKCDELKASPEAGGFKIPKSKIRNRIPDISYPYKIFLRIPDTEEIKSKYYARIADADLIITGKGDADPEHDGKWRIWFLVPREELHPQVSQLWYMNNRL